MVSRVSSGSRELDRTMIQFGEWLPDQPDFSNPGLIEATNVIPALAGYRVFPQAVAYSNAATGNIRGIFAAKDNNGNAKLFAGDDTKLYAFNPATNNLDDVSKVGGYSLTAGERWKFVQFGEYIIATGGIGETPQKFELGTDTVFSDLTGSPDRAEDCAVVRDFVFLANIDEGSGRIPYRVSWSGFNDITSWTSGIDQSDFQDIVDAGACQGVVGGEFAIILMERAVVRATYTGPPLIFQFDRIENQRGCKVKNSICNVGNRVFFLSDDGFYATDGQSVQPIGNEKVNKWFANDFNSAFKEKMSASVDPLNQIAMWSYTSNSSPSGEPDRIIVYNYALNRWSLVEIGMSYLAPFYSGGYTVDQLDAISATVDAMTIQTDSQIFRGGEYFFGGAVGNTIYTFTGTGIYPATIVTGEAAISQGSHSIVTRLYPYFDAGSVDVQIGVRDTSVASVSFTPAQGMNAGGFVPFRASGRYHRAKLEFTGFDYVQGIDIEARKVGRR
jgi:hypothetical protein